MNIFKHTTNFFGCLDSEATGGPLLPLFRPAQAVDAYLAKLKFQLLLDSMPEYAEV